MYSRRPEFKLIVLIKGNPRRVIRYFTRQFKHFFADLQHLASLGGEAAVVATCRLAYKSVEGTVVSFFGRESARGATLRRRDWTCKFRFCLRWEKWVPETAADEFSRKTPRKTHEEMRGSEFPSLRLRPLTYETTLLSLLEQRAPRVLDGIRAIRNRRRFRRQFLRLHAEIRHLLFSDGASITVQSGPFRGLRYFDEIVWGSITPKWHRKMGTSFLALKSG